MSYLDSEVRPWGSYHIICNDKKFKIKKIEVNPGQRLSYQYHNKRSETWTVISGIANVTINDKDYVLNAGDSITIPLKAKHRVENKGLNSLIFIEVQTGSYFGEDDIVRLEDDYNRLK